MAGRPDSVGEHIVAIDGTDVRDLTTDAAAGMLQGVEGTRVVVEVTRSGGGSTRRMSLTRRAVTVKSIPVAKIIDFGVRESWEACPVTMSSTR